MYKVDVAVVGGGCAGLWAAKTAAAGGAATLLVERLPRIGGRIVCAEGVGAAGMSGLLQLKPEWIAASINGAKLVAPDGSSVEMHEPNCGYVLNKALFLKGLYDLAAREGVEIWLASEAKAVEITGTGEVALDTDGPGGGRSVRAKAMVAADGIESVIARRAGIRGGLEAAEIFSCAQYTVSPIEVRSDMVEFHFGRAVAPGGYAWVFPKGDSTANVGVGLICDGGNIDRPAECLKRFKQQRCPHSRMVKHIVGGVPSMRDPFKLCAHGIFVAGDAAGIADPVSGAGIVSGMESGTIAGTCAGLHARGGGAGIDAEKRYANDMKKVHKDRSLRFAIRRVVSAMSDEDLSRLIGAVGEFAARGSLLKSDPFRLAKFLVRAMPRKFGIIKNLMRS